jgi:hypothetical protein
MQPGRTGGGGVDEQRELRVHRFWLFRLARAFDLRGRERDLLPANAPTRDILRNGLARMPDPLRVRGDRFQAATRRDAVGLGLDDVRIGTGARVRVVLLDQQPAPFAIVFAAVAAHQHPATAELFAMQPELEFAAAIVGFGIALRLPMATIPQQHGAGTVLLRRYHAFELAILERMILDMHRETLVVGIEARAFRNRPAQQNAVELEAKVVVQVAGGVLLDDEQRFARTTPPHASRGFRRRPEIALLTIEFEAHRGPGVIGAPAWRDCPRSRRAPSRRGRRRSAGLEVPLEIAYHRPDARHGRAQLLRRDAPFLRPVPGFVLLVHIDARSVLSAAQRSIVGHGSSSELMTFFILDAVARARQRACR